MPELPALLVVTGDEPFLVERELRAAVAAARAVRPELDVKDVVATALEPGELAALASPSLFGDGCLVVIRDAHEAGKATAAEIAEQAASATPEAPLVLTHAGGAKGKALLDQLSKQGASVVQRGRLKSASDRAGFVRAELKALGRSIDELGVRALLETLGGDARELATACAQLVVDTEGEISSEQVLRYHSGKADATSFTVADRAVEGNAAGALEELRFALDAGVAPVLVVSAIGQGLRGIARVAGARGGSSYDLARSLGMPAWKIDRVRRQLPGWKPEGIAAALTAVAVADAAVKGSEADPEYALERLVLTVAGSRGTP